MGDKESWPTIEWLATRTEAADAAVPREEAVAILEALTQKDATLRRSLGHDVDCIFCGFKDREVDAALVEDSEVAEVCRVCGDLMSDHGATGCKSPCVCRVGSWKDRSSEPKPCECGGPNVCSCNPDDCTCERCWGEPERSIEWCGTCGKPWPCPGSKSLNRASHIRNSGTR